MVVSDGWDNAPPGLAGEVLRVWRTRLDPERRTSAVHVNPVYDADGFDGNDTTTATMVHGHSFVVLEQ